MAIEGSVEQGRVDDFDAEQFDADMDMLFNKLFDKVDKGEMTLDQVRDFFPTEVQERKTTPEA